MNERKHGNGPEAIHWATLNEDDHLDAKRRLDVLRHMARLPHRRFDTRRPIPEAGDVTTTSIATSTNNSRPDIGTVRVDPGNGAIFVAMKWDGSLTRTRTSYEFAVIGHPEFDRLTLTERDRVAAPVPDTGDNLPAYLDHVARLFENGHDRLAHTLTTGRSAEPYALVMEALDRLAVNAVNSGLDILPDGTQGSVQVLLDPPSPYTPGNLLATKTRAKKFNALDPGDGHVKQRILPADHVTAQLDALPSLTNVSVSGINRSIHLSPPNRLTMDGKTDPRDAMERIRARLHDPFDRDDLTRDETIRFRP